MEIFWAASEWIIFPYLDRFLDLLHSKSFIRLIAPIVWFSLQKESVSVLYAHLTIDTFHHLTMSLRLCQLIVVIFHCSILMIEHLMELNEYSAQRISLFFIISDLLAFQAKNCMLNAFLARFYEHIVELHHSLSVCKFGQWEENTFIWVTIIL